MSARARYRRGTLRACAPAETLARWGALARAIGVTRLAELTGLDDLGVPVVSAIRPNGRSLSTQQGKGVTLDGARASALMESLETWHAEHLELPVVRASVRALGDRAIDVDGLARARAVPRARRLDWVEGWDLVSGSPRLVPFEAVTLDCTFDPRSRPVFERTSTGLASGNHRLEAIAHGLAEVIERDAEARWRMSGSQRRVVLDTIRAPDSRRVLARLRAVGTRVGVWDLTSDVGVPVYGATLMEDPDEPSWRGLGVYQGFGCHLDPEIAVSRALTEAIQTRLTYIAGSRDDFFPSDYAHASDPAMVRSAWASLTAPPDEVIELDAAPRAATGDFAVDVATLCRRLVATGVRQIVYVELTRPALGVPVVKVLVPGRAQALEWMG
ncbi:MAG: YcaO-like family protein [Kofleriaceae bacterium]